MYYIQQMPNPSGVRHLLCGNRPYLVHRDRVADGVMSEGLAWKAVRIPGLTVTVRGKVCPNPRASRSSLPPLAGSAHALGILHNIEKFVADAFRRGVHSTCYPDITTSMTPSRAPVAVSTAAGIIPSTMTGLLPSAPPGGGRLLKRVAVVLTAPGSGQRLGLWSRIGLPTQITAFCSAGGSGSSDPGMPAEPPDSIQPRRTPRTAG